MQDLTGKKFGKYELRERLGRGGMAEVYKAYQPGMDRFVAIKVMLAHLADDDGFVERFKREAQAVGKLRHPHIVQIFDFGSEDDIYFMAMEFIQGGNLKAHIIQNQRLDAESALRIASQLADALDYAHRAGMIHRDLKPANVMFIDQEHKNAVLTDFGIARIMGQAGLTGTGMAVGTPSYMSPEAGRGENVDERSDLYALGIILYEMLTGSVPYDADTPLAVIMKHISAPLPTRRDYGNLIPAQAERVMLRCLAKDPEDRFATAGELKNAIDQALQELQHARPTEASPAAPATRVSAPTAPLDALTQIAGAQPLTAEIAQAPLPAVPAAAGRFPLWIAGVAVVVVIAIVAAVLALGSGQPAAPTAEPTTVAEVTAEPSAEPTVLPTATPESATPEPATPAQTGASQASSAQMVAPPREENLLLLSGVSPLADEVEGILFAQGREAALAWIDDLLSREPDNFSALFARSELISLDYDEPLQSRQDAERMIELAPDSPLGYIALSDSWLTYPEYDYDQALAAFQQAQAIAPQDPQVLWRAAFFAEWDERPELFDAAERAGARGWRFMRFASQHLYDIWEWQRALPYLQTLWESGTGNEYDRGEVRIRLMGALIQVEQAPLALPIAAESVVSEPYPEVFANAAFVAFRAGDLEQARQWAQNAVALSGEVPQAKYILALLDWWQNEDLAAALEDFAALEGVEIPSPYVNFDYHHDIDLDRGRILADAQQFEQALGYYASVIERYCCENWLFEERANLYIQLDQRELAIADLRTAYEMTDDPDYRQALLNRLTELSGD